MSVRVSVKDDEIVVIDPISEWRVSYKHSAANNGLVATEVVTDRQAKVSERSLFLATAFRKACDKARKLGWMAKRERRPQKNVRG